MKTNFVFRAWFYFRQGFATYLAFILSAINTLTVTYYLAIEKAQFLQIFFPSFLHYVIIITVIGIPALISIGYIHFKKSGAIRAEADIGFEVNPHMYRILANTEAIMPLYLKMSQILLRFSKNEKLSDDEINEISELQKNLSEHIKNTTLDKLRKVSKV